ncbi:hypothetical protein Tco_1526475 [Tanacetum coccineum]
MSSLMRSSSIRLIRIANQNQRLRSLPSLRQFSTESSPPPSNESAAKPIFESPSAGAIAVRNFGVQSSALVKLICSHATDDNCTLWTFRVVGTAAAI